MTMVLLGQLIHLCKARELITATNYEKRGNGITIDEIRVDNGGLVCVSFVARATVYLSMLINPQKDVIAEMSHHAEGNRLDAFLYRCFEAQLYAFIRDRTQNHEIVMFAPERMYAYYVNIEDFAFVVENARGDIKRVVYNGVQDGFQMSDAGRSVCMQQSHFPFDYNYRPSTRAEAHFPFEYGCFY